MTDADVAAPGAGLTGWRLGCYRAFGYLIGLFVVGVVVQFFLAGYGVFGDHVTKVANADSLNAHRALGSVLGLVAVIIFLLALAARPGRATVYRSLALAILTLIAQPALAGGGDSHAWIGGLHAVDGILILVLAGLLTATTHRRRRTP